MREGKTSTEDQKDPGRPAKETLALARDSLRIPSAGVSGRLRLALPRASQASKGCRVRWPHLPLSRRSLPTSPDGAGTAAAHRGLFGAVEWKIDFNLLCGDLGARSALPDQGSWHS